MPLCRALCCSNGRLLRCSPTSTPQRPTGRRSWRCSVGDLNRQAGVEQGARGCLVAVALVLIATIAVAALAFSSVATPILAGLLVLGGAGLVVVDWAARG